MTKLSIPPARVLLASAATVLLAVGAGACGDSGPELSEFAKRGKSISAEKGCAGCHGANGQGGVGPAWIDLAGSDVELTDGTTVIADDEYLLRSILDPRAEIAAGFTLQMPINTLSEDDANNVVAYIKELTSDE